MPKKEIVMIQCNFVPNIYRWDTRFPLKLVKFPFCVIGSFRLFDLLRETILLLAKENAVNLLHRLDSKSDLNEINKNYVRSYAAKKELVRMLRQFYIVICSHRTNAAIWFGTSAKFHSIGTLINMVYIFFRLIISILCRLCVFFLVCFVAILAGMG